MSIIRIGQVFALAGSRCDDARSDIYSVLNRVGVFSFLLSQVEKHQTSGAQAVIIAGQWLWVFLNLTIASIVSLGMFASLSVFYDML